MYDNKPIKYVSTSDVVNPQETLYLLGGASGDKFYDVIIKDYPHIAKYGQPEKQIFTGITVTDKKLSLKSYTVTTTTEPELYDSYSITKDESQEASELDPNQPGGETPVIEEGKNLILDNGFEEDVPSGSNYWMLDGGTRVNEHPHTGNRSLRFHNSQDIGAYQGITGISAGVTFEFSAWGKATQVDGTVNEVVAQVKALDSIGNSIPGGLVTLSFDSSEYTQKKCTFTTPAETSILKIITYKTQGTEDAYLDDLVLKKVTAVIEPETENLIENPGFESGNSNWDEWGPYSIITSDVKSGINAVELGDDGGLGQSIMAGQGMELILSAWGKSGTEGDLAWVGVDCIDKDGTKIPGGKFTLQFGETTFEQKEVAFTTVEGTVKLVVYVYHNPSATTDTKVILDDLRLVHKHENMVNNPSFESDKSNWDDWGNFFITDDAKSGAQAARLGNDGGSGQQRINVTPGTFSLSAWAKVSAEGDMAIVGFNMYDAENNRTREVLEFTSTAYEYKEKTVTIPDGTVSIEPYIYKNPGPGEAFIDDIRIIPVKDVATPEIPDKPIDFERVKAIWVWDTADVLSSKKKTRELLDFCTNKGINLLYINIDQGVLKSDPKGVKALIAAANTLNIKTEALDGNMYWVLEENHHLALASISSVINFNKRAKANERFLGIHHDNEPYTVPGFWDDTQSFGEQYLDLAVKSKELIEESGSNMTFAVDIPFWYDEHPVTVAYNGNEKPLSFHIIDITDYVAVMDYRDFAEGSNGIIGHGLQEIEYAKSLDKHTVLGVETIRFDEDDLDNPALITFAEEGEITVNNTIANDRAAVVSLRENSLEQAFNGTNSITVEITKAEGADEYLIKLPGKWLTSDDADKSIEIKTELGSIKVPLNMIVANDENPAGEVSLNISRVDTRSFSRELKNIIENRPVIGLDLYVDGVKRDWENSEAPVIVSIPYTPTHKELKNPERIVVLCFDWNAVSVSSGRYIAQTGCIEFETTHLGKYAISYTKVPYESLDIFKWMKDLFKIWFGW
ncbi:MAG: hypothetical protein KBA53_03770 [Thermoclostridium sp.]|nr:hypothetical protein [Thermoclostridium sp.]